MIPWGFWVIVGIVLGIALFLMPMAFRPEPAPRRPSISRPIPRAPVPHPGPPVPRSAPVA
jgi:hypothetical protein